MKKKLIISLIVCFMVFGISEVKAKESFISDNTYIAEINPLGARHLFDDDDKEEEKNDSTTKWKNPCSNAKLKEPLKFIGYIVLVFKIIIPILLIIFGMLDLLKAVTSGKDGELFKSAKSFVFRLLAGVLIFFLPTIIEVVFSMVDSWGDVEKDYNLCAKCILNVSSCDKAAEKNAEND